MPKTWELQRQLHRGFKPRGTCQSIPLGSLDATYSVRSVRLVLRLVEPLRMGRDRELQN